jgi:hypothetical protein
MSVQPEDTPPKAIVVEYLPSCETFVASMGSVYRRKYHYIAISTTGIAFLLVAILIKVYSDHSAHVLSVAAGCIAGGALLGALILWIAPVIGWRRSHYRDALHHVRFEFSDSGIIVVGHNGSLNSTWDAFREAWDANTVYMIFFAPEPWLLIPKTSFTDAAQESAFRDLVQNKVGQFVV